MFMKFSSSTSSSDSLPLLVKTDLDERTGIATVTLNRPPANSLSLEMCQAISESIKSVEANKQIQAMVVTSSLSSIFSAGLDLTELYDPEPNQRLPEFWRSFQQVYLDLYGSRLSTIAAINGHAPAAGCMIALSCDYRIMSSSCGGTGGRKTIPTIGLNESKVGIVAPPWLRQQYVDTIGHRKAELALLLGTLFNPQQALEIGLVDEVVEEGEDVVEVAKQRAIDEWIPVPSQARALTKQSTRGSQINNMIKNQDLDLEQFRTLVCNNNVQTNLGLYLEQLTKKPKENK